MIRGVPDSLLETEDLLLLLRRSDPGRTEGRVVDTLEPVDGLGSPDYKERLLHSPQLGLLESPERLRSQRVRRRCFSPISVAEEEH